MAQRRVAGDVVRRALVVLALGLAGCPEQKAAPDAGAPASDAQAAASAQAEASAPLDGKALATANCMACHSDEMLRQQRLTKAQWTNVVKKMSGWGATVEPSETAVLVDWLAATYGPDAGEFAPASVPADVAAAELAEVDDGPFAGGDAARGKDFFAMQCGGCHAPNARGQIGVNLVDRPILKRARDLAATVRKGRGKMTPLPAATDAQIADVVAYLRSLR
jgi:mono/diheme cytochrome c family protein